MIRNRRIVFHLLLVVAGWLIVTVLGERQATPFASDKRDLVTLPTKKSNRMRPDVAGGKRLLERFAREMSPLAPREPSPYNALSLEDKIDHLIAQDPYVTQPSSVETRERYRGRAILGEIAAFVYGQSGPDYSYAFRHGRMEAEEILDLVAARLPEHATDPYFPVMLYHCLVRQDPRRAEPLLAGLPDRERVRQHDSLLSGMEPILSPTAPRAEVTYPSSGHALIFDDPIIALDPDVAFALLASTPMESEPYRRFDRGWVWRIYARQFANSYRDDYVGWIQSLPPGPEREMIEQALPPAKPLVRPPVGIFDTPGTR